MAKKMLFTCANCSALYHIVLGRVGPETAVVREIACRVCGGPLPAREGNFVLKYFLLRKADRRQMWQRRPLSAAP